MAKTQPARAVGEKLDPNHLPATVAFWIRLSERHEEVILMPSILPDSYTQSLGLLVRLGVAAHNPDNYDVPVLAAATENETAQFMIREYKREAEARETGREYVNRYDTLVRLAETALNRGLPEQDSKLVAVIPFTGVMPAAIPMPRNGADDTVTRLAIA